MFYLIVLFILDCFHCFYIIVMWNWECFKMFKPRAYEYGSYKTWNKHNVQVDILRRPVQQKGTVLDVICLLTISDNGAMNQQTPQK